MKMMAKKPMIQKVVVAMANQRKGWRIGKKEGHDEEAEGFGVPARRRRDYCGDVEGPEGGDGAEEEAGGDGDSPEEVGGVEFMSIRATKSAAEMPRKRPRSGVRPEA